MTWPRGALESRNFRLLLACDVVSVGGTAVATVALPFAVLAIGGTASDVGWVATASTAAMIMFLLLGGVVADRLPRHKVMMAANALQGLAQGASAGVMLAGHARVWELAGLAALRGVGLGFYLPAAQGLLPQTVAEQDRAQATAVSRIGRNGAAIGGSALGGLLIGLAGPGIGLAVDAATFAVAIVLRAGMRLPARATAASSGMLRELREGWAEFAARRWLWAIVAEFTLMTAVIAGALNVLGPVVAAGRLGGARGWGVILAAYGAGAVLGGAVMVRYRPQRMLLVASVAAGVFALLLFALALPLPPSVAVPVTAGAALVVGGTSEVFSVNWFTAMQQEIPPDLLSRLSAYDALGSFALAPAGVAVAGPLASAFGAPGVLVAGGLVIVALTLAVLGVPEVRQLRRDTGPAVALEPAGDSVPLARTESPVSVAPEPATAPAAADATPRPGGPG